MKKRDEITEREMQVLRYIKETVNELGYPPSIRDIRAALGIRSTSTVHAYLSSLEEKGYIARESAKSRSMRVSEPSDSLKPIDVPLIGKVTAGVPILAQEAPEGTVSFTPDSPMAGEELFALRVRGESMIEAGILDGDIVIVKRQQTADDGEIVVALIDDEATVKELHHDGAKVRLQPRNHKLEPIFPREVAILGRVIASLRYYS